VLEKCLKDIEATHYFTIAVLDCYQKANDANANASLLGLMIEGIERPVAAGALTALETQEVTSLITNSRLVKAGQQGF